MEKELKAKLKVIEDLAKKIAAYGNKILTKEQKAKEQELIDRLDFRLKELVIKVKLEEATLKEQIMNEIIEIIK